MTPCQVWSHWTYALPYYSIYCCWYITLNCDIDLWPWTFAAYRLWHNETDQIWTTSSKLWHSYCNFRVSPYDLEHCISCCAQLGNNFHQAWPSTTYPCLHYTVFLTLLRCHAVTLSSDPLTLKDSGKSSVTWSKSVQHLSKIEQSPAV